MSNLAERLREHANWSGPVSSNANACMQEAADHIEKLTAALSKIDAIRNSIIGCQAMNWSAHVYPLVAALGDAGYEGQGYEEARAEASTLLDQRNAANHERDFAMDALTEIANLPERGGCGDGVDAVELWMLMQKRARAAIGAIENGLQKDV